MESTSVYYHSPLGMLRLSSDGTCINEVHFLREEETIGESNGAGVPVLQQCQEELMAYFQGTLKKFNVPVHQHGTEFQQRVWSELLQVPFGKTISYLTLAKRLGDPKAIRAAAATNGKNRIAIIVPCHRVIGSHNDLVGYAGGLWRKKWLLDLEAKISWGVQTLF